MAEKRRGMELHKSVVIYIIHKFKGHSPTFTRYEFSETDEAFLEEDYESFDEYVDEAIQESIDEVEQRLGSALALTEESFNELKNQMINE